MQEVHPVLRHLVEGLDFDETAEVIRRYELMASELSYLTEHKPALVREAERRGWTASRLRVVFCLNSFYQRILAPLVAASISPSVIGAEIPIRYGRALRFDSSRNTQMTIMGDSFAALCVSIEVAQFMLEAQHTGDLLWQISRRDGPDVD
jgi:hypothetical protein